MLQEKGKARLRPRPTLGKRVGYLLIKSPVQGKEFLGDMGGQVSSSEFLVSRLGTQS